MRFELFDYQTAAVNELVKSSASAFNSYRGYGELSSIVLSSPTGSGKTVIAAAVVEALFYGNETFDENPNATVLWLSDNPSLNDQTKKRFAEASDRINGAVDLETVDESFAKSHAKLERRKAYFLNRQKLSSAAKLGGNAEGGRSFYDVLANTIEDDTIDLYVFIDEAHRGVGKSGDDKGATANDNKTIYDKLIDGQRGVNKPLPVVIGITATPDNFEKAMKSRTSQRCQRPCVRVPIEEVRKAGIVKDRLELRAPKKKDKNLDTDLNDACEELRNFTSYWRMHGEETGDKIVDPLMVVQVEDKCSKDALDDLCRTIMKNLPELGNKCFANVFGEHADIETSVASIPYCAPDEVEGNHDIRVLFAKDAVSTGWDCPRAEVLYSRRRRKDVTYITQMVGRMIRTPLAKRIHDDDNLNAVSCFLPEYDGETVKEVVEALKKSGDEMPVPEIETGGTTGTWNGGGVGQGTSNISTAEGRHDENGQNSSLPNTFRQDDGHDSHDGVKDDDADSGHGNERDSRVGIGEDVIQNSMTDTDANGVVPANVPAKTAMSEEMSEMVKRAFESTVSMPVMSGNDDPFKTLLKCLTLLSDEAGLMTEKTGNETSFVDEEAVKLEFCAEFEAAITTSRQEFERNVKEIRESVSVVIVTDPLTGEKLANRRVTSASGIGKLEAAWSDASRKFGGPEFSKFYVSYRTMEKADAYEDAVTRFAAGSNVFQLVSRLEKWATEKTKEIIAENASKKSFFTAEDQATWEEIEGDVLPFVTKTLTVPVRVKINGDGREYEKHVFSDSEGKAKFKLNDVEHAVVMKELSQPNSVAWLRNEPNKLNIAFAVPYEEAGVWKNMYPDFIFFNLRADGTIARTIADPHGDWLSDSVPKLKGYVNYIERRPDDFAEVVAITSMPDKTLRAINLTDPKTRKAVKDFVGSSAKELFNGPLSYRYHDPIK